VAVVVSRFPMYTLERGGERTSTIKQAMVLAFLLNLYMNNNICNIKPAPFNFVTSAIYSINKHLRRKCSPE
jgi:hypothetical protein